MLGSECAPCLLILSLWLRMGFRASRVLGKCSAAQLPLQPYTMSQLQRNFRPQCLGLGRNRRSRAEEKVQQLTVPATLAEDWSWAPSFPHPHWWLTPTCNSSSWGNLTPSSGLYRNLHIYAHIHIHINKSKIILKKNIRLAFCGSTCQSQGPTETGWLIPCGECGVCPSRLHSEAFTSRFLYFSLAGSWQSSQTRLA